MGWQKKFRPNCSLLRGTSFRGVTFGVLDVNNPKGTNRASFLRNSAAEQSSPALRPESISHLDPSPQVSTPTGIPPHIHQAKLTKSCLELCKLTLTEVEKMSSHVKKAVCDAFKANASKNGILTMQTLAEMLTVHHNQIETLITTRLTALHQTAIPAKALVLVNQGLHDDFELAHGVTR
jgi:hypothetical protein